ncbi:hypothetical protein HPG69_013883, partial [Diceros bicornis minor]
TSFITWPLRARPAHLLTCRAQSSQLQDKDRADSERLAMSPNLTFLLGLGALPRPSISAKSGSVIPGAWPVTIICQGPAAAETFRLEKDRKSYRDQRNVSQLGPHETEARFHITAVSDDTARGYCCRYFKRSTWSECSEVLELKVTEEDVSALPSEEKSSTVDMTLHQGLSHSIPTVDRLQAHMATSGPFLCSEKPCPMGGSVTTITSTAFLCLETLLKPTIWAEPDSAVTHGKPVYIWCQGSRKASQYYLYREGLWEPWGSEFPLGPGDKAKFSFLRMTDHLAGSYHCLYRSKTSWSFPSKTLDLVVTGMFNKPTLSALPSPVVTSGESVTLQCRSWQGSDRFFLCHGGGDDHPGHLDSQRQADGWSQVLFTVGPVSPSHRWAYRCYGYFSTSPYVWSSSSDILELLISGEKFTALPQNSLGLQTGREGPHLRWSQGRCRSDVSYERFALIKEGGRDLSQRFGWQPQAGLSQTDFPLGPVSGSHREWRLVSCWGWRAESTDKERCKDRGWDEEFLLPRNAAPTLSAHPGPTVAPGESVTLRCQTQRRGNRSPTAPQDGEFQANFPMSPVTLDHGGTYRCYGSLNSAPFLLSRPSHPLELLVTGPQLPDYTVQNLIRLGLSGLILVVLGVLICEAWHSQRRSLDKSK